MQRKELQKKTKNVSNKNAQFLTLNNNNNNLDSYPLG